MNNVGCQKWSLQSNLTSLFFNFMRFPLGNCCCCSAIKLCLTLCDPMGCSIAGFPVLHCPPEFSQTHVHCIDDVIQPSHSLLLPSPPALNPSQNQGLFQWSQLFASGGQCTGVSASTAVLPLNIQDWSPLGWTGWISLWSKGLSRAFSNTTVQKHQLFSTQPSSWSKSHIHTWLLEKP